MIDLKVGDRFYYTGDMANCEDFGTITARYVNRWGEFVDTRLDDGRIQKRLYLSMFEKGSGQRFKPIKQYEEEKQEGFNRLRELTERGKK